MARRMVTDEQLGLLMVGGSGACFAASTATGKLAMSLGAPAFFVTFMRGGVMCLVVSLTFATLWLAGRHPLPVRHWLGVDWRQRRWLVLRATTGTASVCLSFLSLHLLPLSDANALTFTWPAFALLASCLLLRERVRAAELCGLVGAICGSVLVVRPTFLFGASGAAEVALPAAAAGGIGYPIALLGACSTGITIVLIRKLVKELHWTVVLIYQTVGQLLFSSLAMLMLRTTLLLSPAILLYCLATGVLASIHQILLTKGLARTRVGPAGAMQATFVLTSFGLQAVFTPEDVMEPIAVAGAVVIVLSVAIILGSKRPPPPSGGATATLPPGVLSPERTAPQTDCKDVAMDMELNDAAIAAQKLAARQEEQ